MKQKRVGLILLWIGIGLFFAQLAFAADSFVIRDIKIQGLQGLSTSTVYSYLPVKIGDTVTDAQTDQIIDALYKTGFFDDVSISRSGNVLVIKVVQRPVIGSIHITGNKEIPTDKLMSALKDLGFAEGQIYNAALLDKIKTSLKHEYFSSGKYNATIDVKMTPEPRNRVSIDITISEGTEAKIKQISIIGNHVFSDRELLKQFKLSTTGLFSFYTHSDQYSREKLEADLETLRSYYMDRGYLKFHVDSTQVSLSPNRKEVYISIQVTEGMQYKLTGYDFSGDLILSKETLTNLAALKVGDVFARKDVVDASKRIVKALGDKGYANAKVDPQPVMNDKNGTVFLHLHVTPGQRMYVRHIVFADNYRTNDDVLRRNLTQFEGSVYSSQSIEDSRRALLLLPYVRDVDVTTKPVSGKSNQVDMDYKITEQSAAELQAGIAYSQLDKFMITGSIEHKNVFGTGNSLSLSAATSSPSTSFSLTYDNPYTTKWNVGRSVSLYTTHFNSSKANVTDYVTNNYGLDVNYDIPMTQNDSIQLGYGYENVYLGVGNDQPTQVSDFVDKHGRHFYQAKINAGWISQGLDRAIFPTRGLYQSLSGSITAPFNPQALEYYKLGYDAIFYHPIYQSFIGQLRGSTDYGNGYGRLGGKLPFFKNFYVGGMGSVRGFEPNTIGPKDSNGDPLGGNFDVSGTAALIFPNPLSQNVRTTWFVDGGNAYDQVALSRLRFSTGLELDWLSPIGMLNFSIATPIRKYHGDSQEFFQFNVGASF